MKHSTAHFLSLASVALALSACGGGSETEATGTTSTTPTAPTTTSTTPTTATAPTTTPTTATTPTATATAASGTLTLSGATPAAQNGTVDVGASNALAINTALTTVSPAGIDYCDIKYTADSSSGSRYEIKVYFRRSDQKVLNASFFKTDFTWGIGESDLANGITSGVSVNLSARSITFTNKVLNGFSGTDTATVNGTVTFPANATVAACGA